MKTEEFAYWLQGALELNPDMLKKGMTPEQVQTIQDHLNLVFKKVTPDRFKKDELNNQWIPNIELPLLDYPNNGGTYCGQSTNVDAHTVAIC